jgi:hypothetical protein
MDPMTVSLVKTTGDGVSAFITGKTSTDFAISKIVDKECSTANVFKGKKYCRVKVVYNKSFYGGLTSTYKELQCNAESVSENIINPVNGVHVNKSMNKGKNHESKLGKRHKRNAHKVRSKRSNQKAECKPPRGIFGFQDPFLARRTGRNETCSKK